VFKKKLLNCIRNMLNIKIKINLFKELFFAKFFKRKMVIYYKKNYIEHKHK